MTATYTNQPGTRPIDTVRLEIDDRDTTAAMLTDEEIQYAIDSNSHILLAAAACADQVAVKFAGDPSSKQVGDLNISYGAGRSAEYATLARRLRARAARKAGSKVYAGGVTSSDRDVRAGDTSLTQPTFTMGQMDHDGTGTDVDRGVIDY